MVDPDCIPRVGRNDHPSAGIIDSQSVRTIGVGGVRGYDRAKRVNGRKRHILVDSGGLVLRAKVHPADIQDRAGVPLLLEGAAEHFPHVEHLWVDKRYTGAGKSWIEEHLGWRVEVVRHPLHPRGEWLPHGNRGNWRTVWFPMSDYHPLRKSSVVFFRGGGRGADLCLALSEPTFQSRLRAPVYHQRGTPAPRS